MDNEIKTEHRPETEGENQGQGNITVKRNKTADFFAKIVCVVLAFFMWYYASSLDTVIYEDVFEDVSVVIENKSSLSLLSGDGMTVDVTLSGKRSVIRSLTSDHIRAYAVIEEDATAGRHEVDIVFDLPNGVTLEKTSVSSAVIYIDETVSKDIPVEVVTVSINHATDCELLLGSVGMVTVSGPKQEVDRIDHAVLPVDTGNQIIAKSISYTGKLVLKDENGDTVSGTYVKFPSSAKVTIQILKERSVPIVVRFKNGLLNDDNCDITLSRSEINIKGDAEKIKDMVIEIVVDEKTISDNGTNSYTIKIPDGMTNMDGVYNVTVTVDITGMTEKTFTVTPTVTGGALSGPMPSVDITLRGKTELINKLTASDIKAVIDVKGLSGMVSCPVKISLEGEFATVHEVYEADSPYTVSVTVSDSGRRS